MRFMRIVPCARLGFAVLSVGRLWANRERAVKAKVAKLNARVPAGALRAF